MDSATSVKHYNHIKIRSLLDVNSPWILNHDLAKKYSRVNYGYFPLIDRTGSIDHFLPIQIERPIPKYKSNYNKHFYDVTVERAHDIVQTGKELCVLWSGGLDSTTIIAALIAANASPDQVIICMTVDSLLESGNLYDKTIRKFFPRYVLSQPPVENFWKNISVDSLVIHGMSGNLIMGVVPYHIQDFMMDFDYRDYTSDLDFFQPAIDSFTIPIKTLKDFWNFYSFNFYWNANHYHFHRNLKNASKRCINFFGSDDYQDWYISGNESGHDKIPMRNFIESILGNPDYTRYKKIRFSYIRNEADWLLLTSDDRVLTSKDLLT